MNREEFRKGISPETGEAQVPLWFWNEKLNEKEIERQLKVMSEKEITCNAPHARSGYVGEYLDEEWMSHMEQVIRYKRERGETMWLYDEFNWPAGIANGQVTIQEEFREKYLEIRRFDVPAGERFRRQPRKLRRGKGNALEEAVKTKAGKDEIDNIFCFDRETMKALRTEEFQPEDLSGVLFNLSEHDFEICRDRDTVVYEVTVKTERYEEEGILDPDYLNPEATKKFIDVTYEAYAKRFPDAFGTVITAGFNDETRFCHAFPWTERLPELFEKRYGYRLEKNLPALVIPGETYGRIRCDYYELLADLYRENYHEILNTWCKRHGIAYCPHLLGEETLAAQVRFSGDYLRQFCQMGRPGVDHLGRGIGSLNIQYAASGAEIYGKTGLVCEVFAACGWELTFQEYLRMISWLYSQGVKTITNHGFFYSVRDFRKNDWPPSQFFQWDGWKDMEKANRMCRRLYGILNNCERDTGVLIYHPVETYWFHNMQDQDFTHGYHMGPFIRDERAAQLDGQEQILLHRLQENNRGFTMFSSDAMDQFLVEKGALINKNNGCRYRAFVLPFCEVLPVKMLRMLREFVKTGGHLVFWECFPKYGREEKEDREVQQIVKELQKDSRVTFLDGSEIELLLHWLERCCPQPIHITEGIRTCKKNKIQYSAWLQDPYIHTGEDMSGISWTTFKERNTERTWYFFVNYTGQEQNIKVELPKCGNTEIWDPFTGEIQEVQIVENGERKHAWITVPEGRGILLLTVK